MMRSAKSPNKEDGPSLTVVAERDGKLDINYLIWKNYVIISEFVASRSPLLVGFTRTSST